MRRKGPCRTSTPPTPRSFIGEGKAEEVRQLVLETGANMVIFDNDLTPRRRGRWKIF